MGLSNQPTGDYNELMPTVDYPSFKLLIIGNEHSGKTTFVKRHIIGKVENKIYDSELGVVVSPLDFTTSCGKIRFYCWDTVGQEICGGLGGYFYTGGQCAIIMFDVTDPFSYRYVSRWYEELCKFCKDIPIVLCGNKVDLKNRKVKVKQITFHREKNLPYYEISAKSNYNVEKPFLYIAQELLGNPKLHFVESPALAYPEALLDLAAQKQNEAELAQADCGLHPDYEVDNEVELHGRKHTLLRAMHSCFGGFHAYRNEAKLAQAAGQPHPDFEVDLHARKNALVCSMHSCFGDFHVYRNEAKLAQAACKPHPDNEVDLHTRKHTTLVCAICSCFGDLHT